MIYSQFQFHASSKIIIKKHLKISQIVFGPYWDVQKQDSEALVEGLKIMTKIITGKC